MLLIQIEILASLQSIDQKIEQQQERKQRLLGELEAQEEEIRAKKQEIEVLVAGFAEKEQLRLEKDRFFQDEGKKMIESGCARTASRISRSCERSSARSI